jgi:hypothetical protein
MQNGGQRPFTAAPERKPLCCQQAIPVAVGARAAVTGQRVWPVVLGWVQGSGSDCAEEPVFR